MFPSFLLLTFPYINLFVPIFFIRHNAFFVDFHVPRSLSLPPIALAEDPPSREGKRGRDVVLPQNLTETNSLEGQRSRQEPSPTNTGMLALPLQISHVSYSCPQPRSLTVRQYYPPLEHHML
jgi:hypothetical protein